MIQLYCDMWCSLAFTGAKANGKYNQTINALIKYTQEKMLDISPELQATLTNLV